MSTDQLCFLKMPIRLWCSKVWQQSDPYPKIVEISRMNKMSVDFQYFRGVRHRAILYKDALKPNICVAIMIITIIIIIIGNVFNYYQHHQHVTPCPRQASLELRYSHQQWLSSLYCFSLAVVWARWWTDRTFQHTPPLTRLSGLASETDRHHLPCLQINANIYIIALLSVHSGPEKLHKV